MSASRYLTAVLVAAAGLTAPATATATDGAESFNAPGQRHAVQCVQLGSSPAPLRFADGAATGFGVDSGLAFDDLSCPDGSVRLDLHELIPSSAGALAFHRGGNGYVDDPNVKYGELATTDLATALPPPVPASGGRGAPCALSAEPPYTADVRSIPSAMHYKRPQDLPNGSNSGSSFEHYGDPAADQGDRHDIHYSYLLWSFVNVSGGGMVRTLVAPGQLVRACDVAPVTMDSWDRDGNVNGQVTARYVRVLAGSCPLYGWIVWSHTYLARAAVAHVGASTAAPPPDPTPGSDCPVAAPGAPPGVVSGNPSQAPDGSWTVAGSVDPHGTTATFRVEFGPGSDHGSATADAPLAAGDGAQAVSASLGALAAASVYHYRVVATTVHGTTYGDDRTLVTPPPPPPPPVDRPAALPKPPLLSALKVTPGSLRRARTRQGTTARIGYRLSAPAAVALSFQLRVVGVRGRSGACRPAPRRGVPRAARPCARWASVRGVIKVPPAAVGARRVRFGGWIGARPMAKGSYRVLAVPGSGAGRLARFSVR